MPALSVLNNDKSIVKPEQGEPNGDSVLPQLELIEGVATSALFGEQEVLYQEKVQLLEALMKILGLENDDDAQLGARSERLANQK